MVRRRDPWAPFRIWIALTIAVYAVRATFVTQWPGALPGWVLLAMVMVALLLAALALLLPGRLIPWRGEPRAWWELPGTQHRRAGRGPRGERG